MPQNNQDSYRAWAKVVAKAWADEAYKNRLMSDPLAVLKAEGVVVPDGVQFKLVEDTATLRHLVLPALPNDASNLDHTALEERLAASISWCCHC